MSDEEAHSGSRWEPSPADQPTERHGAEADGSVAVAEAEHPVTTPNAVPPAAAEASGPRAGKHRRAVAAAIGAGLLLVGGGAGYAIGHTTAVPSGPGGAFGHGHGGFRDGQGAGPGGAGTSGTGSTGTGTGTSGTGTGTGTSGAGNAVPST